MFNEWIYWLTSRHPLDLAWLLSGLLLVDGPRYAMLTAVLVQWAAIKELAGCGKSRRSESDPPYCPSVCVLLVGHNEADTIYTTLESVYGSWPKLDIVVVDDGSTDGMDAEVRRFQQERSGIQLFRQPERSGKTSGLNRGLQHTSADVIVTVDADSRLAPHAIQEIVQPLRDPQVGAVSGTVRAWNEKASPVAWFQAYEYRQTLLVGRALQARFGLLGIVSGAFGAFRREALEQIRGWDVGPGEDGDVILRLRRSGYGIETASAAECFTNVPETFTRLAHQRRRWDRTVVTFETRKYASSADLWSRSFRASDFVFTLERWFFNILPRQQNWWARSCSGRRASS
jgi:cellulose synthase/poly-beta-1,6-N-acetylglucosamine synthase-like glycosyltransferase